MLSSLKVTNISNNTYDEILTLIRLRYKGKLKIKCVKYINEIRIFNENAPVY